MRLPYNDHYFMSHALRLAEQGLWSTDPNPRVGCVLVKDGKVVGEGWHHAAGQAHAEVNALQQAGDAAKGSTCYITLEPCCHQGRTPPCSQALIKAGVARVVVATQDPNPLVGGGGISELNKAGIEVEIGVLGQQAEKLNPGFFKRMRHQRPYVRCKMAMSLDGRTAMSSGESKWITGDKARQDVQSLRARSSAIMTGVGTVLSDNPSMNVRPDELPQDYPLPDPARHPLRVIIDNHMSFPLDAKMLDLPGDILLFTASDDAAQQTILESAGVEVIALPNQHRCIDLDAVCSTLAEREINEVHLECGATLAGTMLQSNLIDELVIYMSATIMGHNARGLFYLPSLDKLADRHQLEIEDIRAVGKDWRITAKVNREN